MPVPCYGDRKLMYRWPDSICIFAFGKNYGSHQFLNWWQEGSIEALRLDGFESDSIIK